MSVIWMLSFSSFMAATCAAAAVLLVWRARSGRAVAHENLADAPLLIRVALKPARVVSPWMASLVPARMLTRSRRDLDAVDLLRSLEPHEWMTVRIVHASVAGVLAGVCAAPWTASVGGWVSCASLFGFLAGGIWLRRKMRAMEAQICRDLPAYLDLLTVCVEAGSTLTSAMRMIVERAPQSALRAYFERVLRAVRSGQLRADALTEAARSYGSQRLSTLASALAHAEASGMNIGQILRAQSEQRSEERFLRAEKLALEAPVKMLGPLIFCIFPCTFIVLAVPITYRILEAASQ